MGKGVGPSGVAGPSGVGAPGVAGLAGSPDPSSSGPQSGVVNVVVAGLGGQGVVKASDIVADAAFRAGWDVKKAEVHGMSQRGGSVSADVRFGPRVLSPMVPPGEAAFLVVVAADQVEVHRGRLAPDGVLIAPDLLAGERLPHPRSVNVALLGALSTHLVIAEEHWLGAIRAALAPKLHPVNEAAFALGRQVAGERSAAGR